MFIKLLWRCSNQTHPACFWWYKFFRSSKTYLLVAAPYTSKPWGTSIYILHLIGAWGDAKTKSIWTKIQSFIINRIMHKQNCCPINNRAVRFPIIDAMFLFATVQVQSCFPFVYLFCLDITFALHGANWWKNIVSFWDHSLLDDSPMVTTLVVPNFFYHGLDELVPVLLFQSLVQI